MTWPRHIYVALLIIALFSTVVHAANHQWGWLAADLLLVGWWTASAIAARKP